MRGVCEGSRVQYAVFYGVLEVTVRCAWPEEATADISEGVEGVGIAGGRCQWEVDGVGSVGSVGGVDAEVRETLRWWCLADAVTVIVTVIVAVTRTPWSRSRPRCEPTMHGRSMTGDDEGAMIATLLRCL